MTLKIGSNNISDVYFGNQKIKAIFCGSQLVFKKHEDITIKHTMNVRWGAVDTHPSQYPAYEYFRGVFADDNVIVGNGSTVQMLTIRFNPTSIEWGELCSVMKISGFSAERGYVECYGYAGSTQTTNKYYADKTIVEPDGSHSVTSASVQLSKTPSWCVYLNNQVLSLTNEGNNQYIYRLGDNVIFERNKRSDWFVGREGNIYVVDTNEINEIDDAGSVVNLYTGSITGTHVFLSCNEELYSIVSEWGYNEQNEYVSKQRLRKVDIEDFEHQIENPWMSDIFTLANGTTELEAKYIGRYNECSYVMVYPTSSSIETGDENIEVLKIDEDTGRIVARFDNFLNGYPNPIGTYNDLGDELLPIPQEPINGRFLIGKHHKTGSSSDQVFYTYVDITFEEEPI